MNVSRIRYEETKGLCYNSGVLEITHNFTDEDKLIEYLRNNWFDLENADRISDILVDPDTKGVFNLMLDIEE